MLHAMPVIMRFVLLDPASPAMLGMLENDIRYTRYLCYRRRSQGEVVVRRGGF